VPNDGLGQIPAAVAAPAAAAPKAAPTPGAQRPYREEPAGSRGLKVTEIFAVTSGEGRMAMVNGLPVMEGSRVDDALVREIRDGEILFEIAGQMIVVPLRAGD
jgi:hypothetical protein